MHVERYKWAKTGLIGLTAALWVAMPLAAQTQWYVATNGNHTAGTSWPTALTNIQDALDAAAPNDTVNLAGHTFVVTNQLVWPVSDLTLIGGYEATNEVGVGERDSVRWPTVLTRDPLYSTRLLLIEAVENARIEDVEFRGARTFGSGADNLNLGAGLHASQVTNLTIAGCRFVENEAAYRIGTANTANYGGGLYALASYGIISNTLFSGNTAYGQNSSGWGGGAFLSDGVWQVVDSVFIGNTGSGGGHGGGGGGGVYASGGHTLRNLLVLFNSAATVGRGGGLDLIGAVTVDNATVYGNTTRGIYFSATTAILRNSIVYGNAPLDMGGSVPSTLLHNCIGDGTGAGGDDNFSDDPDFERPLFYLRSGSPCRESGDRSPAAAGLAAYTTQTNGAAGGVLVDRGFHHREGLGIDRVLYVNPDDGVGIDTHDGLSPAQPLRSITRALALSAPRTRIHLAPGIYNSSTETFPLAIVDRTVQLIGTARDDVIIDALGAGEHAVQIRNALGDVRLEHLTIRNAAPSWNNQGGGLYAKSAFLTIENCVVSNNTARRGNLGGNVSALGGGYYAQHVSGLAKDLIVTGNQAIGGNSSGHGGGVFLSSGFWLFDRVDIRHNHAYGSGHGGGFGGGINLSGQAIVRNSLMFSNSATTGGRGGGLLVYAAVTIDNSTIVYNQCAGIANAGGLQNAPRVIENSIVWGNTPQEYADVASDRFFFSCSTNLTGVGQGNIDSDPLFMDPLKNDFRLQPVVSPAIDAGINRPWMIGATDLQGLPRILTGRIGGEQRVDMGAYETLPPAGSLILFR